MFLNIRHLMSNGIVFHGLDTRLLYPVIGGADLFSCRSPSCLSSHLQKSRNFGIHKQAARAQEIFAEQGSIVQRGLNTPDITVHLKD